jgi:hypothetical protein
MKLKLRFLFLAILLLQISYAQPTNTNISSGVAFDGEPYLAINPTNHQNLVAAWMGIKLSGGLYRVAIKTRASFDGGNTWSAANALPHFGTGFTSADVSMAFDKNGLLYLSYIDSKQAPDSGGIYVARSFNGGLNWDAPSKAFDMYDVSVKRPIDRPWLVVDKSNTSNSGTLYITTKPAPWIAPPNRNYYKVSVDSGRTWTAIASVDGGTHLIGNAIAAPMASPATTLNGNFCAVYPSYVTAQNVYPAYYLATSNDKGQSFNYTTVYAAVPAASDTNIKKGYLLLAHPLDSNKLTFLTIDAQAGDADIVAFQSGNAGQTWSGPVRINDDTISNGKLQDMVWGAYNKQGNLAVSWRDRRLATGNGFWNAGYDFYYATSTDNGKTFSSNQKFSSQFIAFDSITAESGNDFMSCVYSADTLYSVWGDTRSGKMNIYFVKTIASNNSTVGITLLQGEDISWNLFPNPTKDELNIAISEKLIGKEMIIFDALGKQISQTIITSTKQKIRTSDLAGGIYFLRIDKDVKRFVKQ